MPIPRKTASQYRSDIAANITAVNDLHDTAYGPIRDVVIDAVAPSFESASSDIRKVSLLISLLNSAEFSDSDLEAHVANEGIVRHEGSPAVGAVVFYAEQIDPNGSDYVAPRGYPVGTVASNGVSVTFITTETATLPMASAGGYYNAQRFRYETTVPIVCVVAGSQGRVGANRIARPLRPLVGFTGVVNLDATSGGRARETNQEMIDRYLLAIIGRDTGTPQGIERFVRDQFAAATDTLVVHGGDEYLTRAATDAGAVDSYIIGQELVSRVETLEYLGVGQLIQLSYPPLVEVTKVEVGITEYDEDVDFEVVRDDSGLEGSTSAADGIRWLSTASPPVAGDAVTITYTSNDLVRQLQDRDSDDDRAYFGRNHLYKQGERVDIILEATLTVVTGFTVATVNTLVTTAVINFINGLGLGDDVEVSDVQGEVRRITGVDNFVITRLVRTATSTGAADLAIERKEYARIAQSNLIVT